MSAHDPLENTLETCKSASYEVKTIPNIVHNVSSATKDNFGPVRLILQLGTDHADLNMVQSPKVALEDQKLLQTTNRDLEPHQEQTGGSTGQDINEKSKNGEAENGLHRAEDQQEGRGAPNLCEGECSPCKIFHGCSISVSHRLNFATECFDTLILTHKKDKHQTEEDFLSSLRAQSNEDSEDTVSKQNASKLLSRLERLSKVKAQFQEDLLQWQNASLTKHETKQVMPFVITDEHVAFRLKSLMQATREKKCSNTLVLMKKVFAVKPPRMERRSWWMLKRDKVSFSSYEPCVTNKGFTVLPTLREGTTQVVNFALALAKSMRYQSTSDMKLPPGVSDSGKKITEEFLALFLITSTFEKSYLDRVDAATRTMIDIDQTVHRRLMFPKQIQILVQHMNDILQVRPRIEIGIALQKPTNKDLIFDDTEIERVEAGRHWKNSIDYVYVFPKTGTFAKIWVHCTGAYFYSGIGDSDLEKASPARRYDPILFNFVDD